MELGFVGLGRMGANMVRRLRQGGHSVTVWNRSGTVASDLSKETGAKYAANLVELVHGLKAPRVIWLMLPAGAASEQVINTLSGLLAPGDLLVDGANAHYKEAVRHAEELQQQRIGFVDAGVSGGIWGLQNGYALMLGGEPTAIQRLRPAIETLAPASVQGWVHCGPCGAGHFAKMVHNGIEYGMMQAFAEGLSLMRSKKEFNFDLAAVTESWRHGSVVRSWLLDLTAEFLKQDATLDNVPPVVADSGEGRWTAIEAIEQGVPAPVMSLALMMRFASQGQDDYAARLMAMMRKGFGGHALSKGEDHA